MEETCKYLNKLHESGFRVFGVVCDNHYTNVFAYTKHVATG